MHFDDTTPLHSDSGSCPRFGLDGWRLSVDTASNAWVGNVCYRCPRKALCVVEAPFDAFGSQSQVEPCIAGWVARRGLRINESMEVDELGPNVRIGINVNMPYRTMSRSKARKEG
jgi:hypothetical protein